MDPAVLSTFTYTDDETQTFPYLAAYRERVLRELESPRSRVTDYGYALAGLFLTYRACNHTYAEMTTLIDDPDRADDLLFKRVIEFRRITGCEITDQGHYLRRIRYFPLLMFLRVMSPAGMLLRIARLPHET